MRRMIWLGSRSRRPRRLFQFLVHGIDFEDCFRECPEKRALKGKPVESKDSSVITVQRPHCLRILLLFINFVYFSFFTRYGRCLDGTTKKETKSGGELGFGFCIWIFNFGFGLFYQSPHLRNSMLWSGLCLSWENNCDRDFGILFF